MKYVYAFRICLAVLVATAGLYAGSATAEDTIALALHKEVFVRGPEVLLGDLADIEGPNAAVLADVKVVSAAQPGKAKEVTASYVLSRLRYAGIEETPTISGANRVRITTEAITLEPSMIADDLRQFINEKMPWDPVEALVTIEPPRTSVVMPDGVFDIVWRPSSRYNYLGTGAFNGTIQIDGIPQKTILVKAGIDVLGTVVVAARDIPRGRPISRADVELREQSLSENTSGAATSLEEVLGKITRRTHFPGQVLSLKNIQAPVLIKRNQLVTVEMQSGSIFVQTRAKALNEARAGDFVVCANPVTKKQFQGVAMPDGTVLVE